MVLPPEINSREKELFAERYWLCHMDQCSHERNYNTEEMATTNPEAFEESIWSYLVWWDTADWQLILR